MRASRKSCRMKESVLVSFKIEKLLFVEGTNKIDLKYSFQARHHLLHITTFLFLGSATIMFFKPISLL